ncbi:MAG: TRAP transporter substrate-binding protein [Bacteroidetes bacterium]|nr:TRAP transporter substrate-binding protein [Bacteroidota bacterium]MCB0842058.1 TRAP transporter substrate-binding protein [Bacteroidota bacterium]
MKNYIYLLLIGSLMILSGCRSESKVRTLKLAHGLPTSHPVHEAMVFMAEQVEKKSEGKMRIDVYPSQQLGDERQCLELLQIGSIAITKVSAGVLENFAPIIRVLGLPYVFRSKEHHFKVLDGPIGQRLLESPQKYLLRGLCFYDAGSRSFYTKDKPIRTPEDLNGLKIRVMESKTATEMVNGLGGSATPISWGELYSSLQQGVVDGAENNPPSFYTSRHYEICKYYSINEHTAVPDVLIISTIIWNQLNDQEKKWLTEAVEESVPYERKVWEESVAESLKKVQEAGVEVIYPDKEPFMEKLAPVLESYKDDSELYELIQEIRAVKVEPDTVSGEETLP